MMLTFVLVVCFLDFLVLSYRNIALQREWEVVLLVIFTLVSARMAKRYVTLGRVGDAVHFHVKFRRDPAHDLFHS